MANVISTLLKLDSTQFKTGMKSVQDQIRQTDGVVNKAKVGWGAMFSSFASSPIAIGAPLSQAKTFPARAISAPITVP